MNTMNKPKVLIVEDEIIIAKDIEQKLLGAGNEVAATVAYGEIAISKVEENVPDLILMDIRLKGDLDGIETSEIINKRFNVPIVYLTSHSDRATLDRAKLTTPYGYVLKPFNETELLTTVEMSIYKHQMEKKLSESESWLTTTLKSIGDAVIATDANGKVKFMNPVAEDLTGWNQAESEGRDLEEIFNIVNEDSREKEESPVTKVMREGKIIGLTNHTVLISKYGDEIPIDDSAAPIRNGKDNMNGVVLVFRDITNQKQLQEELIKAQKLESIGVLAGGIAHDFNNLLTMIMGNIGLAEMFKINSEEQKDILVKAEDACLRAKDLTQQLLTFSKGGQPRKEIVYVEDIIKYSAELSLSGSNVICNYNIAEDLNCINADQGQLNQVFNNLIINAREAMPEGGAINISAENIKSETEPILNEKQNETYVKISIKDQGLGIPKNQLNKIFEPYYTTKHEGSGLGLAMCYSIVTKHDGFITAKSILGEGTTFELFFPASNERPKKVIPDQSFEDDINKIVSNKKVLIMDDEESIRYSLMLILKSIGFDEVGLASDGSEAVELYQNSYLNGHSFDLVILDLTIPGKMGGKEAINKLLEIDQEVVCLVSSGYSDDPVMSDSTQYGFKGSLAKPYKIKDLRESIKKLLTN